MNIRTYLTVSLLWFAACGGSEGSDANSSYCSDNAHDIVVCKDQNYDLGAAHARALEVAGDDAVLYGITNNSAAGPFTGDGKRGWLFLFLRGGFSVTMGVRATAAHADIHSEGVVDAAEFDCGSEDALKLPDARRALIAAVDTVESKLGTKLASGTYTLSYNHTAPCNLVSNQAAYGEPRTLMQLEATLAGQERIWNVHTTADGRVIESCEGKRRQITCSAD